MLHVFPLQKLSYFPLQDTNVTLLRKAKLSSKLLKNVSVREEQHGSVMQQHPNNSTSFESPSTKCH